MSKASGCLKEDENIVIYAEVSKAGLIPFFTVSVTFLFLAVVFFLVRTTPYIKIIFNWLGGTASHISAISLFWGIIRSIDLSLTELVVTTKRIAGRRWFFCSREVEIPLEKFDVVSIHTSPLGHLLNYHTIVIRSCRGTFIHHGVKNAFEIKDAIYNALDK